MVEIFRGLPVFSVSELGSLLDRELERSFHDIWVEGEVSNFSLSPSGHCYFRMKDGEAVVRAAFFRQHAVRLPFKLENGMALLVRGRLGFYGKSGELQLYVSHAEPYGIGALQMALEQSKKRLLADGLTDPSRKRAIPRFPGRVGIVTSAEGAAIRDIISVLERRSAPFEVIVAHSPVQGGQAPERLAAAMKSLFRTRGVELIILTRGGGSFEDLNAFNDEALARLAAASPVPVISAVGHETDTVLTDLTADLRAPTPSAAAEIISQPALEVRSSLAGIIGSARAAVGARLSLAWEKLLLFDPGRQGQSLIREIDRLEESRDRTLSLISGKEEGRMASASASLKLFAAQLHPSRLLDSLSGSSDKLSSLISALCDSAGRMTAAKERIVDMSLSLISERSPLSILSRGYSVIRNGAGKVIGDSSEVAEGECLSVILRRGRLKVSVDEKE